MEIKLQRSSNRPAFDRLARTALTRALKRRPVTRKQRPVEACYRVAALFTRVPPLPMAGCQFDEVHLKAACFYPLMKVLKPRVTLVSARYARR